MADLVVAIDGPAGAGKSTVARLVGERLGLPLLDTGAMYRCVALSCLRDGVSEREGIIAAARRIDIRFAPPAVVLLDGEDVSGPIRTLEVGQAASEFSTIGEVREEMVRRQKEIVSRGGTVLEGRDVTTVVAPNADVKVFLTASIEERARRRWVELKQKGDNETLQNVVRDVVERDHRDYTRTESPLQLAEDAVIVESFGLSPEQVADRIIALVRR